MPDVSYFARRAAVEQRMAERASGTEARDAHLALAALHDAAARSRPRLYEGTALSLQMPPAL